ncbi:MAG: CAP domain-containing protein, partial [Cytophagales bacterium]|nr:CAP domain-containing protein [Rhizobacter sp.]
VPVCCTPTSQERAEIDEVFKLLNEHRQANGVPPLEYDLKLEAAIQGHCQHMAEADFFDHTSPVAELASPWTRAELCGSQANAENIAAGQNSAAKVMTTWKNSSGHNQNMLNAKLKRVGIGMVDNIWGQLFGS